MTVEQLATVFEEWKTRFDANPDEFQTCAAFEGEPPQEYGRGAAMYFAWLIGQMGLTLSPVTQVE